MSLKTGSEVKREQLLNLVNNTFEIKRGHPWPLGTTLVRNGVNFAIISSGAKKISLVIYGKWSNSPLIELPLDPRINKTGDIWHAHITGLDPWISYAYRVFSDDPIRSNGVLVLDPYAKATSGGEMWGQPKTIIKNGQQTPFRLSTIVDDTFDWGLDQPLNKPLEESIIYEMHIRGFTKHSSAQVMKPGTFAGVIEKIPYLKELGITAVELMPVTDFDELGVKRKNPISGETLKNYWGYDPISFFALKSAYAHDPTPGGALIEFKKMVKALHKAGIEVIIDIVFNHTAEGNEKGDIFNFKVLDRDTYYLFDKENKHYLNYSGCGNTVNCNHPVVRSMIIDSLRYWVTELHVDGFRFDLASILSRGHNGEILSDPPILERIALDPVLTGTKIIAEAWDAAGLYQVGDFPHWQRWMEWNGKFRDDVRRFIKGDEGMIPLLAKRLSGSSDLYEDDGREPYHSVNFVSCHDGFPMSDLVTFSQKSNLANGEQNRDGENHNNTHNWGVEGLDANHEIIKVRKRQVKNFATILLLSQGVPMFHAGDEFGRTQGGNNNAYCQDNKISWLDWSFAKKNAGLLRFFKLLIAFRKKHSSLKRSQFKVKTKNGIPEMSWHGTKINKADWSKNAQTLSLFLAAQNKKENDIYIMINGSAKSQQFELPKTSKGKKWGLFLNTFNESPHDILDPESIEPLAFQKHYPLEQRSIAVFVC
jgi:isoamylase